jgi:hypothetical protein
MRGLWLSALLLACIAMDARAEPEPEYVTQGKRVMCTTPEALREALHAIEFHDRNLMMTIQGCRYSVVGVPAELVQDNINMIKIKIGFPDDPDHKEFWTLPDSIKRANGR